MLFQRICFCGGFWCHTVILSLSPGRTALFLKRNTLNSQRFTLLPFASFSVQPHLSAVCTEQLHRRHERFKAEGRGFRNSFQYQDLLSRSRIQTCNLPVRSLLVHPLGCFCDPSVSRGKASGIKETEERILFNSSIA